MVGRRKRRLRLTIGAMMDLEDHFGMGLVPFLAQRLPEFKLKDLSTLFLAMTDADYTDPAAVRKAGEQLIKAGLADAAIAISACLQNTLSPDVSGDSAKASVDKKTDHTPPGKL